MIWHPISEPIPERLWHKTILFLDKTHQDCSKDYCIHHMLGKSDGEDFYFMVEDWKIVDFTHWAEIEGPKDE